MAARGGLALARVGRSLLLQMLGVGARLGRQLEHGRFLALAQEHQKKRLTVRQLESIMVHMEMVLVDLSEDGGLVRGRSGSTVDTDLRAESNFGARKNADCGGRIARR